MNETIAVCIIAKNEEALLGRCLESVKEADAIYVCDTGSTDKTVEIAKKYTDNVCTEFTWNNSFCDARNHVKSHAKEDWILSIDCDEFLHDFEEVRKAVRVGKEAVGVLMIGERGKADFHFPRLFRNIPQIEWNGAVHNHLTGGHGSGERVGNVKITYGYSPAHQANPDRTLNILLNEVKDPTKVREMYYLGREYWYRQDYEKAAFWFGKHVLATNFTAEKADSFLTMARCYSAMGMDDDARDACLQAINLNPQFKEAVKFMGAISLDVNASQWYKWAETCDSRNVLFVRE